MFRTHTCGELNSSSINQTVTLCGWVQKSRDLGGMTFIDLRDRFGVTQIVVEPTSPELHKAATALGREFVISVKGTVRERSAKETMTRPPLPIAEWYLG